MQRCWTRHGPPTHIAAALYLGLIKPKAAPTERLDTPDDLAAFLRSLPATAGAPGR